MESRPPIRGGRPPLGTVRNDAVMGRSRRVQWAGAERGHVGLAPRSGRRSRSAPGIRHNAVLPMPTIAYRRRLTAADPLALRRCIVLVPVLTPFDRPRWARRLPAPSGARYKAGKGANRYRASDDET
jgi:hypothetical protein